MSLAVKSPSNFPLQAGNSSKVPCILCGVGTIVLVAITLLVVGILGATGAIQMAPVGADWMIGLGSAMILGMISAAVKICCGCK